VATPPKLEAFDVYVRTVLPEVLAASKRSYSRLLKAKLMSNLEHMFGE
jgi:hypothetical protein